MSSPVGESLNKNSGVIATLSALLMAGIGLFMQVSFDRLFGDIDRLKESQAVMQTNLSHSMNSLQDVRVAVRDSEGKIQNLVIRVSVLEEKVDREVKKMKAAHESEGFHK